MDNIYIEYNFEVSPKEPATEILIAELGMVGFESFVENDNGVTAYIQKQDWNQDVLANVFGPLTIFSSTVRGRSSSNAPAGSN